MKQFDKKAFSEKIKALIIKTEKEIIDLEESAKPVAPENSIGRISRMDAINNKSVVEAALRTKKSRLGKLRIALTKINDEDFGQCENCKKVIAEARLMFLPESALCIRCAR